MFCQQCNLKATYRCCSTILLCNLHYAQHFSTKINHQPQQLELRLDATDQEFLNIELQNRILTLKNLKGEVKTYTRSLIETIEDLQTDLLKTIDQTLQKYEEMFNNQEFTYINESENILETEMVLKEISSEVLKNNINELFPSDLISLLGC